MFGSQSLLSCARHAPNSMNKIMLDVKRFWRKQQNFELTDSIGQCMWVISVSYHNFEIWCPGFQTLKWPQRLCLKMRTRRYKIIILFIFSRNVRLAKTETNWTFTGCISLEVFANIFCKVGCFCEINLGWLMFRIWAEIFGIEKSEARPRMEGKNSFGWK